MDEFVEALRRSLLFKGLCDSEILAFAEKFDCKIVEYRKNECIITKDESAHFIGVILEGSAGVYTDSYYGGHTLIGIADQDYLFGFIAMFFNSRKSITTLYCRDYCKIAYFRGSTVSDAGCFIQSVDNKILVNIYAMLAKHIHDDFDRAHMISTPSVLIKLVRYLLFRYIKTGKASFDLVYTRTELASFLGVYRTSLSHAFKELRDTKAISIEGAVVTLLDVDRLIALERDSYGA